MSDEFEEKSKYRQRPSNVKIIIGCLSLMLLCGISALLGMIALRFLPCIERPEPEILIYPDSHVADRDTWDGSPTWGLILYEFETSATFSELLAFYENESLDCRAVVHNPDRIGCDFRPTDWYNYRVLIEHIDDEIVEYVIEVYWEKRCISYTDDWYEY